MKTFLVLAVSSALTFPLSAHSSPHEYYEGKHHEYKHMWCSQNWEKCKELEMNKLQLKEDRLKTRRECLEKSKSFEEYRACKYQSK